MKSYQQRMQPINHHCQADLPIPQWQVQELCTMPHRILCAQVSMASQPTSILPVNETAAFTELHEPAEHLSNDSSSDDAKHDLVCVLSADSELLLAQARLTQPSNQEPLLYRHATGALQCKVQRNTEKWIGETVVRSRFC